MSLTINDAYRRGMLGEKGLAGRVHSLLRNNDCETMADGVAFARRVPDLDLWRTGNVGRKTIKRFREIFGGPDDGNPALVADPIAELRPVLNRLCTEHGRSFNAINARLDAIERRLAEHHDVLAFYARDLQFMKNVVDQDLKNRLTNGQPAFGAYLPLLLDHPPPGAPEPAPASARPPPIRRRT